MGAVVAVQVEPTIESAEELAMLAMLPQSFGASPALSPPLTLSHRQRPRPPHRGSPCDMQCTHVGSESAPSRVVEPASQYRRNARQAKARSRGAEPSRT